MEKKYIISEQDLQESRDFLIEEWGDCAKAVIDLCDSIREINPFVGDCGDFLDHCLACGKNWTGMWLTGIKKLYPAVYEIIPNNMGKHSFSCIGKVLMLLGVDTAN